jgi:hypothetical protein
MHLVVQSLIRINSKIRHQYQCYSQQGGVPPTTSKGTTLSSSLLRAHAPNHHPLPGFTLCPVVFADCCQPLLGDGSSRCYLCTSVPGCLGHDPGGPSGAHTCFFPDVIGLPHAVPNGSALPHSPAERLHSGPDFEIVTIPYSFRPPGLLATQVSPTATAYAVEQPWLFHSSTPCVVTFTGLEYASRSNQAIND